MIKEFIRASAGTGKTHRILNNVFKYDKNSGGKPSVSYDEAKAEINKSVFLTFSNSAAEEIRDRIYKGLALCEGQQQTDLAESFCPDGLNIRVYTIHSFALEMLKLFRYKLGLPAEIDFSAESKDDETIWQNCVEDYFKKFWHYNALKEELKPSCAEEKALFDIFFYLSDEKELKQFIKDKGDTLFFLYQMGKSAAYGFNNDITQEDFKKLLDIDINDENYIKKIFEYRNQRLNFPEGKAIEKSKTALKEAETYLKKVCPLLNKSSCFVEKITAAIGNNLYMPQMFLSGTFDFDAVVYLFIKDLIKDDVNGFIKELKAENYSFENLYIDEAQDNDIIQNYLIIIFGNKDCPVNLTVVGDLKQSIYSWRKSYPKEFAKMGEECDNTLNDIAHTNLKDTYRIKQVNTLNFVNTVCDKVKETHKGWWYENAKDTLTVPENTTVAEGGNIYKWNCEQTKGVLSGKQKDTLKQFLEKGKNAVIIRNSSYIESISGLKEILKGLNTNYRIEDTIRPKDSDKNFIKANTLNPELDFLKIFFGSLSQSLSGNIPFTLFWAESGKLILKQMQLNPESKMPQTFKAIFQKIYNDALNTAYSDRIEYMFRLLDKYEIWKYIQHKHLKEYTHMEIRRIFCHIMTHALLQENKRNRQTNNKYISDNTQAIIDTGKTPLSCYTIGESCGDINSTDIITIHSCKGLTYDNIVIIANSTKNFLDKYENYSTHNGYYDQYSYLFNIDFNSILTDNLQIEISYFPYLGLVPAYVIKNIPDTELWANSSVIYNKVKELIMQENLNLLYVAVTRAKKDILFIDLNPLKEQDILTVEGVITDSVSADAQSSQTDINPSVTFRYNKNSSLKTGDIIAGGHIKTKSVRSEISHKINKKYGNRLDSIQRLDNMKTGSLLHNIVQRLISISQNTEDLISKAQQLKQSTPQGSLRQKALDILLASKETIKNNENILKDGYRLFNEVPVWHYKDGCLIKGSIDTLGFKNDEALIIEYKVLFDESDNQKDFARQQMEKYENMLGNLKDGNLTVNTLYMPFKR